MVSVESVALLLAAADEEERDMIRDCVQSFGSYHEAVYRHELTKLLGSGVYSDSGEYRKAVTDADRTRTACHNAVITHVRILNRMCVNHGLPQFYDGVVSEEKPYRREVANAVFEYVEHIIHSRA